MSASVPPIRPMLLALALLALGGDARAQAMPPPAPAWAQTAPPPAPLSSGPRPVRPASSFEVGSLYLASAAYGLGLGVWLDAEIGLEDPALLLIPPTLLGVAAPGVAYAYAHPRPLRGKPAAIAAGLVIGAGEGLGVAGVQMVTSAEPWGFTGLARAMVIGSTVGGIGGYAMGELQRPSPNISAFATSGVVWGTLVGAMIGYGVSEERAPFSQANDPMATGGLLGFNAGLAVSMALSTAFVPSVGQIEWMWLGAGIGAAASLPVYLLYIGDDRPPAKRGLIFSATATTLGIVAGGLFGPEFSDRAAASSDWGWASLDSLLPVPLPGGLGLRVSGRLR